MSEWYQAAKDISSGSVPRAFAGLSANAQLEGLSILQAEYGPKVDSPETIQAARELYQQLTKRRPLHGPENRPIFGPENMPRTSYRRSTYRRRAPYRKRRTVSLRRKVHQLSRKVNAGMATHTIKVRRAQDLITGAIGEAATGSIGTFGTTEVEAALGKLRYYNPAVPETPTLAPGGTGTYTRQFLCDVYHRLTLRNNYQVPAKVVVYALKPREDTSITPASAYLNGVADQVVTGDSTSPLLYPTDVKQFSEIWRIIYSKRFIMQPGNERVCTFGGSKFTYDPSLTDSHNMVYQQSAGGFSWLVRICGVEAHDTVADEQGTTLAGVDLFSDYIVTIFYDAGVKLSDITIDDTSVTAFTTTPNVGVVSSKPVADNIGYSKA